MKILHIPTGGVGADGISKFILDTMHEMMKIEKISVHIVSPEEVDHALGSLLLKEEISLRIIRGRKKNPIAYFLKLLAYFRRNKFDIIHVHGSSSLMVLELLAAKISGIKFRIAHSHNTTCIQKKIHNFLKPLFHRLYTHALACGKEAGKWLFEYRNFDIIYNGRDLEKFEFSKEKRELIRSRQGILKDEFLIGHVGHFTEQKNHSFLIEIFHVLSKIDPTARLVLIGSGPFENLIRQKIMNYKLEDRVIILGNVDNVDEYYSAMDLLLFPSLCEGFPLVLVEAQANGLEIIASNRVTSEANLLDQIEFLPIDDGLVRWLGSIVDKKNSRKKLNISDEKVFEKFNIKNTAEILYKYYQKAVVQREENKIAIYKKNKI